MNCSSCTRGLWSRIAASRIVALCALGIAAFVLAPVASADPPSRVARLSYYAGTATFSPAGDDQWGAAALNRPVVTGDRLWSDNGARVELALDNGALWMGEATSVVVTNIDDATTQFELQQGTVELRVRRLAPGGIVEVDTPNLAFQVTRAGRYRIAVDPAARTTTVFVRSGGGAVFGEGASYAVGPGQGYRFYGTDLRDSEFVAAGGGDPFDRFVVERDSRFSQSSSARYVSADVVGYEDLDRYGSWRPAGDYGNVWFPRQVASDWAPYRQGHWSWIDPWGWTWVDDAPWGFAPFHYGRWAYVENRWGWVPGPRQARAVYAPALVAFVGGANFSISVASGPAIGWFPLAPRELYRPAYNVSRDYYRQVNVSNTVINTTVINNTYVSNFTANDARPDRDVSYANLRARNAITAVPPAAFAQSLPVARAAVAVTPAQVDRAQVRAMAPVAPTRAAFIGGAPAAKAVPPRVREQQEVVARSAPPPPPVPIAQRMQALDKDPGKPQDRTDIRVERPAPGGVPADRNVRVVNSATPAATAAPPAVRDSSGARAVQPGGARNNGTQSATPATTPAAVPSRVPDVRGGPTGADERARRNDMPPTGAPPALARPEAAAPPPVTRPGSPPPDTVPAPPPATAVAPRGEPAARSPAQAQPNPARADQRVVPQPAPRAEQAAPPVVTRSPDARATPNAATRPAPPAAATPPVVAPSPEGRATPQADRARGAPPRNAAPDPRPAPAPAAAPMTAPAAAPTPARAPESRPPAAPPARQVEPRAAPAAPVPATPPAAAGAVPPVRAAPPRAAGAPEPNRDDKGNDKPGDRRDGQKGKPD